MASVQEIFEKSGPWIRLAISVNIHIKEALINVVHNKINDLKVKAIPSDPAALFAFLQSNKGKIQKSPHIRSHQKSILLPTNSQSVDSSTFDISIIRFLIQTFCEIKNAKGNWKEPEKNDQTLCAYVIKAVGMRNSFAHDNNIKGLNAREFETKWKDLEKILQGLKYNVDLEPFKNQPLNLEKYEQHVILEEFVDHLRSYKEEYSKESSQDDKIVRRFSDGGNKGNIVTESELERLIKDNDRLIIYGEAGLGKTTVAKRLKNEWFNKKILNGHHLIYYDSKRMNKLLTVKSFAAPLYFSELGDYFREKGRNEDDLSIYKCVKTTIDDLIIIIDGIDEFPVREIVNKNSIDELEKKIKNNEEITAAETISAIYFGFLFPYSKVVLLGRIGEFDLLKEVNAGRNAGIFNRRNIDLELLKFDDTNIKDFTCLKICKQPNQKIICTGSCRGIYEKIENIELCKIPTDLNSLLELYKKHPKVNIGKITRTKLIIATLFNRLINHINQENNFTFKSFREVDEQDKFSNYLECIRKLGEISFNTLLEDNITVHVKEKKGQFIYKDEIKVERKIFAELDLFYVRDLEHNSIWEPYHTINIEFLSACYLFSHELDSILRLNKDRQLVIISFIAGLHADDDSTKDFIENVLNTPSYSLERFFSWLYNIENIRESLPNGGPGYDCWFGLMETQKLSPSFFLLDFISQEVEVPQTFVPKTFLCYCNDHYDDFPYSFEWYYMENLKHNFLTKLSDNLNIELILNKFPHFYFIFKGDIRIDDNDKFNLLNQFGNNNKITFRINELHIDTSLNTSFKCNINVNTLRIRGDCDSRTIDMILNALSPLTRNTSSSNTQPAINCKRLDIGDISPLKRNMKLFNSQQTKKLFELGVNGVVDSIRLHSTFLIHGKLAILKNAELKSHKMINLEFCTVASVCKTYTLINIELRRVEFYPLLGLPNLANRHVTLNFISDKKKLMDKCKIKLREHNPQGYANNLANYKVIKHEVSFVRKENYSQDCKQSMFMNLSKVDFNHVSPELFAKTCSLIPSFSCVDDDDQFICIPSSHWSRLSQINNCRIKELRIWQPRPENFEYFLNIKTNLLQLVCESKDELKGLLNHILTNTNANVQSDKQIKVFVVNYDNNDWDYYTEIPVFTRKTIKEYKFYHCFDGLLLDNIKVPFHEGELHLKLWCCEISVPIQEDIDSVAFVSDDEMTSYCYEDYLVIDIPNQSSDDDNSPCDKI